MKEGVAICTGVRNQEIKNSNDLFGAAPKGVINTYRDMGSGKTDTGVHASPRCKDACIGVLGSFFRLF